MTPEILEKLIKYIDDRLNNENNPCTDTLVMCRKTENELRELVKVKSIPFESKCDCGYWHIGHLSGCPGIGEDE